MTLERGVRLTTLKRRAEFLRVRGGLRWSTTSLVLEAKAHEERGNCAGPSEGCRFGFTVSGKVGKAVARNRVRRRLKSAVRDLLHLARCGFDYVVIARPDAHKRDYAELKDDLATALSRVHRDGGQRQRRRG